MDTGIEIMILLKQRKAQGQPSTQRWLLGELRKNGFPGLDEPRLSNVLNGVYSGGYAPDVLKTARMIIEGKRVKEA